MDTKEVIKILRNHIDTLKYQVSDKGWEELTEKKIVRPGNTERLSFIEHAMKQIAAYQIAIQALEKEEAASGIPMLSYQAEIDEELYDMGELHSYFDGLLLELGIKIKNSTLISNDEESIHDGSQKCRVCGCDWFHGCPDGCFWIEEDLCSSCASIN